MQNLSTIQAAEYLAGLGIATTRRTMEQWRHLRRGPEFKRVGRKVYYERPSLDAFARGNVVRTIDSIDREASHVPHA